jgi:hypothetical protein
MSLFDEMGMRFWFEKAEAEMQALEVAATPPRAYSLSHG